MKGIPKVTELPGRAGSGDPEPAFLSPSVGPARRWNLALSRHSAAIC